MKLSGNFLDIGLKIRKDLQLYKGHLKRASKSAASSAANGLKADLRAQVQAAKLGTRVSNAWRSAAFPKTGDSLNAAAVVWTNAPHIIAAFDRGVPIRARNKSYLAIPTRDAPKGTYLGKRITPSNWPTERLGKLHFVKGPKAGTAYLAVRDVRMSYGNVKQTDGSKRKEFRGWRQATKNWKKKKPYARSVIMFTLTAMTKGEKRLDVLAAAEKWHAEFPRLIEEGMR